jgi:tetratricopeptide (TPR) repeat protein
MLGKLLFNSHQTSKIVITGLGGIGKTQLVTELTYRTIEKHENCSVFWIPAMDPESLHQAYINIAQKLQIPSRNNNDADIKLLVQKYLSKESTEPWLLVFDNADDIDMWIRKPITEQASGHYLLEYLPRSQKGSIIFTTRDWTVACKLVHQNIVEISEMSTESSKELFKKCLINPHLTDGDSNTEELLTRLAYLPLAIVQASAYINKNRITITDYLSLLDESDESMMELLGEEFEDQSRYPNSHHPVATTWAISFKQILERNPLAADYLSLMACVEPDGIPEALLPMGPSQKQRIDAIGTLIAYSFVTRREGSATFDLHRLVHLAMRYWLLENGIMTKWAFKATERLVEVFPSDEHENRAVWRAYSPHAIYALNSKYVSQNKNIDYVELSNKVGMCLLSDGKFQEAEKHLREAMQISQNANGPWDLDTLTYISNFAMVLEKLGNYTEAENTNRQVLDKRKQELGDRHVDTLTSMVNLAWVLEKQEKWKEAETLDRQALAGRTSLLGVGHRSTMQSTDHLAWVLHKQDKLEEAEKLSRKTVEQYQTLLGDDHPDTLFSMNIRAAILYEQGEHETSAAMQRQILNGRKKVLGIEHPATLMSMYNLAQDLAKLGLHEEAEALDRQALESRVKTLGFEHPETLKSASNLACSLTKRGKHSEAEVLDREVVECYGRSLGKEHPKTLTSTADLAYTLCKQDKDEEAALLYKEVLEKRTIVLGADHADTLKSVYDLGWLYSKMQKHEQAEAMDRRLLEAQERTLGSTHPKTLQSLIHVAQDLDRQGRNSEAAALYQRYDAAIKNAAE